MKDFINCRKPDWETLFRMYHDRKVSPIAFLMSEDFLDILVQICKEEYPYTAFSDLFHTVRSMLLPVLYILQTDVPKADIYHAIATGYSGILARLGSYVNHVPYEITEHGIYTREREEEIIRAKWVLPAFKRFWVRFFYMLSGGAYEKASMITSLFDRAMETQIEMGCPAGEMPLYSQRDSLRAVLQYSAKERKRLCGHRGGAAYRADQGCQDDDLRVCRSEKASAQCPAAYRRPGGRRGIRPGVL